MSIIPQHLFVSAAITGSTPATLTQRTVSKLRVTNGIIAGSTKGELVFVLPPNAHGALWPWGLRANDDIHIDAWVSSNPNARKPSAPSPRIFTGNLDRVAIEEDTSSGRVAHLWMSNKYKQLEVTTESQGAYVASLSWYRMAALDILYLAAEACGIGRLHVIAEPGLDALVWISQCDEGRYTGLSAGRVRGL